MSKSQTASLSQPSTSPPEIPDHLLPVWETISRMEPMDCWRTGAPILLYLGLVEPTLLRRAEPEQIGEMFREKIEPTEEWFSVANDLGRFIRDHQLLAVALMRVAAIRLVGS